MLLNLLKALLGLANLFICGVITVEFQSPLFNGSTMTHCSCTNGNETEIITIRLTLDFWYSRLGIAEFERTHEGTYTCMATNSLGSDEANFTVQIDGIHSNFIIQ